MSAASVRQLLNLPDDVRQPHAYQVLGLSDGEQDLSVIQSAVEAVIGRLRSVRAATDEKIWNQSAQLVQQARLTLADPHKKAELDARFGIVTINDDDEFDDFGDDKFDSASTASAFVVDPLAGFLPDANPLEPAVPIELAATGPTPVVLATSPVPIVAVATESPVFAAPQLKTASPLVRRRRSSAPMLLFGIVAIGLTMSVVGLTYYLLFGAGTVAIQTGDGGVRISAGQSPAASGPQVGPLVTTPSEPTRPRPTRDRVIGTLGSDRVNDSKHTHSLGSSIDFGTTGSIPAGEVDMPKVDVSKVEMTGELTPIPAASPANDQAIKAADEWIVQATTAIRGADWKSMKLVAEKAVAAAVNDEQLANAQGLYQLADLATYYRGGVVRAIQGLVIGNTFDVTETLPVIVVDTGAEQLTIRYDANTVSYTLDELPLVLAHKLASFQISQDEATESAAKAAYQAITPISSPPYREQAIQWLEQIDKPIEGADRDALITAIELSFAD